MRRYLIIGSGAAGFAAVETLRAEDSSAEIVMVSEDPDGYYSRPGLAYALTGEIPENFLYPVRQEEFKRLGVKRIFGKATCIDPIAHQVILEQATPIPYDRLLIAIGATARKLENTDGLEGVVKLDSLADVRQILRLARRGRKAVTVGGGITALELAEGMAARGVKSQYILRGDRYWSNVLDEPESLFVQKKLGEDGIQLFFNAEIQEILTRKNQVTGILLKDGRTLQCEILAVAIGIQPRLELARASGVKTDRGILTNEYLETSAQDVFAAGDVAQVLDPATGKAVLDSLWHPARLAGVHAAYNMAGRKVPFLKDVAHNVTRLAGLTTTLLGPIGQGVDRDLIGIARGDSETFRQIPDAIATQSFFDVNHLRILVGPKHLVGAVVMGDQTLAQPLYRLIKEKADITPIREKMLEGKLPLSEIIADFWCIWSDEHDPVQS